MARAAHSFKYDVCLSFAGEDRQYVEVVASHLYKVGIRVFYDKYEQVSLWGKNLYDHLIHVYQNAAKFCVVFASKNYSRKLWTTHERKAAQARAFEQSKEYILPARLDDTSIPGLLSTVGYIEARKLSPKAFAQLIVNKVGTPTHKFYLPPSPQLLFNELNIKKRRYVVAQAEAFIDCLRHMSQTERRILYQLFAHGCPVELPRNIHITADFLRRLTGLTPHRCVRELTRLSSLGFKTQVATHRHDDGSPTIELSFWVRAVDYDGPDDATRTVNAMLNLLKSNTCCDKCALKSLSNADFSLLAGSRRRTNRVSKPRPEKSTPKKRVNRGTPAKSSISMSKTKLTQ